MVQVRDVWINWFEGEENGYNVCPFHEWRSEDRVEVLDQAVVVKVTERLFNYIENRLEDLPDTLLKDVYQKSSLRKNMSRVTLDYCFIACDGTRIIAVDTLGYNTPIRKSRLTPRQEQIIYDLLAEENEKEYDITEAMPEKEYHILSPHPQYMEGLTRKERQLKQLLFMAVDQLYTTGNEAEIRYWYTEWKPTSYPVIQTMDKDEVWHALYEEIQTGWTSRHYELCEAMIKGQPFFEKLWDMQHEESIKKN
ncbi:YjbA family protein [Bacillus sp. FJAT-44742]|uniref:YjbA family protein n=1 Tax=Bacillus sp. FJAT-44742 TaxID=2014005 RepID=UPI000C24E964|nr:YjbA family protein [Bacillus sp. FJAT-44742]